MMINDYGSSLQIDAVMVYDPDQARHFINSLPASGDFYPGFALPIAIVAKCEEKINLAQKI